MKTLDKDVHVIARFEDVKDLLAIDCKCIKVGHQQGLVVLTGNIGRIKHEMPGVVEKALKVEVVQRGSIKVIDDFIQTFTK